MPPTTNPELNIDAAGWGTMTGNMINSVLGNQELHEFVMEQCMELGSRAADRALAWSFQDIQVPIGNLVSQRLVKRLNGALCNETVKRFSGRRLFECVRLLIREYRFEDILLAVVTQDFESREIAESVTRQLDDLVERVVAGLGTEASDGFREEGWLVTAQMVDDFDLDGRIAEALLDEVHRGGIVEAFSGRVANIIFQAVTQEITGTSA